MSLPGSAFLARLLESDVLPAGAWDALPASDRDELERESDTAKQLRLFVARRLLTPFQAAHLGGTGSPAGLVLGNYRLRETLGPKGLYRAEHRRLKFEASVQVYGTAPSAEALSRFFDEIHVLIAFRHPGLVRAIDAGEQPGAASDGGAAPYVALERLAGQTLGEWVRERGPMPVERAVRMAHQMADALAEAHGHGIFHRRLDPEAIFLGPEGLAKVAGFGASWLVPADRATAGYRAPEVAEEPHRSDPRGDVFSLAAILLFALTGRAPFTPFGTRRAESIPDDLTALINRMTDPDPAARISSASAALRALAPFLSGQIRVLPSADVGPTAAAIAPKSTSVLLVDDEFHIRQIVRLALAKFDLEIVEADNGEDALKLLAEGRFDLVLLDLDLPKLSGAEVLRRICADPATPHLKVIVLSGQGDADHLSGTISTGADDFLAKPFSVVQLRARVTFALRLKEAQDHADLLARRLAASHAELELAFNARGGELVHARGALVLALAKLVEQRSSETGPHLLRLQRYTRILGEAAAATPAFAARLSPELIQTIQQAAPLHDIGKVAVPDHILNKPGALTHEERLQIQSHAAAGADTLSFVTERFPFASGFFGTAIEIARHHHEKWDGTGYPSGLSGEAIPLSARLVAVGDVYDALRSRRIYKAGEDHDGAVRRMLDMPGHFDPRLLELFARIAEQFREAFDDFGDCKRETVQPTLLLVRRASEEVSLPR